MSTEGRVRARIQTKNLSEMQREETNIYLIADSSVVVSEKESDRCAAQNTLRVSLYRLYKIYSTMFGECIDGLKGTHLRFHLREDASPCTSIGGSKSYSPEVRSKLCNVFRSFCVGSLSLRLVLWTRNLMSDRYLRSELDRPFHIACQSRG